MKSEGSRMEFDGEGYCRAVVFLEGESRRAVGEIDYSAEIEV